MNIHEEEEETRILSKWFTKDVITLVVTLSTIIWGASAINSIVNELIVSQKVMNDKINDITDKMADLKYSVRKIEDLESRVTKLESRMK